MDVIKGEQNEKGLKNTWPELSTGRSMSRPFNGMPSRLRSETGGRKLKVLLQLQLCFRTSSTPSLTSPVGEKVPRPWLRETPFDEKAEEVLSGGGLESLLGAATPSVRSSAGVSTVQERRVSGSSNRPKC